MCDLHPNSWVTQRQSTTNRRWCTFLSRPSRDAIQTLWTSPTSSFMLRRLLEVSGLYLSLHVLYYSYDTTKAWWSRGSAPHRPTERLWVQILLLLLGYTFEQRRFLWMLRLWSHLRSTICPDFPRETCVHLSFIQTFWFTIFIQLSKNCVRELNHSKKHIYSIFSLNII